MTKHSHKLRRIVALAVVGLVVVAATLFYLRYVATFRFWFPPPTGSGPAGPTVPATAFQKTWTTRQVVLLGIGDSVTAGFGADPGLSYFERLQKNPPDEFDDMRGLCLQKVLPNLRAYNLAVSGSDSIQHIKQLDKMKPYPRDTLGIVVMTSGGNDLIHWYGRSVPREGAMYGASWEQAQPWIVNYRRRLNEMLDRLTAAFPGGCHIFLATIYDPSDGVGNPAAAGLPPWHDMLRIHDVYNAIILDSPKTHSNVHIVDMHKAFLGHGVHCVQFLRPTYDSKDPHYWYFANLEDPNNRGYDAIRRVFLIEMAKVLAPNLTR